MFHHLVMMRLTGYGADLHARASSFVTRMRTELPYVCAYHFGPNVASRAKEFRWAVLAVFDSSADHDRYQVSDIHQEMKAFMAARIADFIVCDFDTMKDRDDE
jgi:hypothetical protein